MPKCKLVAILFPPASSQDERMRAGIIRYAAEKGDWRFSLLPECHMKSLRALRGWKGNGVIAELVTPGDVVEARSMCIPVVNVCATFSTSGVPLVMVDQLEIGRIAAEHLLEQGFKRFAYYGIKNVWYSKLREQGFVERLTMEGKPCSILRAPFSFNLDQPWHRWTSDLERWVSKFELPVGVMAVHDYRASLIIDACISMGLRVPEDVAVVGSDNDQFACLNSQVQISSVDCRDWQRGYQAANLLDRLMDGETPISPVHLIPPVGIVQRRSTDVMAADDPYVLEAVTYIREHISEFYGIERLEKIVPVSRRELERRFRQNLHCTPHEYLCRVRVREARKLLAGPRRLAVKAIARACGFRDARHLRSVFQRLIGSNPKEFRRLHQSRDTF